MIQDCEVARILVITKDEEFLNALYPVLGNQHLHVSSSEVSGRGLKDLINEIEPQLAIIDIEMPLRAGIKIALQIHNWSSVSTVLLTSWQTGQDALRRLDVNDPSGLSAPIKSADLAEWIDSIVKRHQKTG